MGYNGDLNGTERYYEESFDENDFEFNQLVSSNQYQQSELNQTFKYQLDKDLDLFKDHECYFS